MLDREQRKALKEYLNDQLQAMVELTQQVCSFPTENPPGKDFKACTDFLNQVMLDEGLRSRIIRVPQEYQDKNAPKNTVGFPRYNVISLWDTGGSKTLHFNSHYDVVPATDGWKNDPYSPAVKGKKLFGRGTMDMKGCLVASIFAVKALRACGLTPKWNIEHSFVADEEIGGACGTGFIVKQKFVRPDAAVVCEGGMEDHIMFGHRGVLWVEVTVHGSSAHGSNPSLGVNAFEKGIALVQDFQRYHKDTLKRKTKFPMTQEIMRHPTMTLGGVCSGGDKINIIPDEFFFTIDRRLIPEEKAKDVQKEFQDVVKQAMKKDKSLHVTIRFPQVFNSGLTDAKSPICKIAQKAVESVYDKKGKLSVFGAFTDLHYFTNYAKCPTIGYGVEGQGLHSNKEYLEIKSLAQTAQVYAEIAMNME